MVAIGYQARAQTVVCELFPNDIFVAWQCGMAAVAEVRTRLGTGRHRVANLYSRSSGVANRDHDTGGGESFDERHRAVAFGGDRHHANASTSGILPAAELVPVGVASVGLRVCAARAVIARYIRPFQVKHRHSTAEFRIGVEHLRQRLKAVLNRFKRTRNQRRRERTDAVAGARIGNRTDCGFVQIRRNEAETEAAVDLWIEETRRDVRQRRRIDRVGRARDSAIDDFDRERAARGVVAGEDRHCRSPGTVPIAAALGSRKVVSALSTHPSANSLPNCGM